MRALAWVRIGFLFLLITGCSLPPDARESESGPHPEVAAVEGVAKTFLSALSSRDTATLSLLLTPGSMIYSVRDGEGGPVLGAVTRVAFLEGLGDEDRVFLERMWSPTVEIDGRVAMVWAPYDFYVDDDFSHCGVDVFTMLKGPEGWQVASITYNVVREGCPPSPLGPPERSDG